MSNYSPINIHIGERLRRARRASKLSLEDVGMISGIHMTRLSRIENGAVQINIELLQSLANIYRLPAKWFVKDLPVGDEPIDTNRAKDAEILFHPSNLKMARVIYSLPEHDARVVRRIINLFAESLGEDGIDAKKREDFRTKDERRRRKRLNALGPKGKNHDTRRKLAVAAEGDDDLVDGLPPEWGSDPDEPSDDEQS